jgi:hypothetical protein
LVEGFWHGLEGRFIAYPHNKKQKNE